MTMTTAITSTPTRRLTRAPVAVLSLLVVSALALTLLSRGSQANNDDLDPANPGFAGAQGLAHVLANHGVKVTIVRRQRDFLDQGVDAATTVAIIGTSNLSGRTAHTALAHAASAASLVLLDPDPVVIRGMGLPVDSRPSNLMDVAAGCRGTGVGETYRLAQADRAYVRLHGAAGTACFSDKVDGGSAMLSLHAARGQPSVVLIGDESLITNGAILNADNAAIALNLFGHSDHLIWYLPSAADMTAADGAQRSITPSWFGPALVLGASAVVLLCLWRGRRLGRLVTEPLPVIVRAVETTESRARMYRKARDRNRALSVLQQATRRRLASYLGLPASATVSDVAAACAPVSRRSYQEVLDLLQSPAAHDDASLMERANTLQALEREARQT
jgi:hypothetical protein